MIEKYISSLLKDNKRVIVPDFGGFVVKRTATGDVVSFNGFLKFNDDLLVTAVAEGEELSKEDAMKEIAKEIDLIKFNFEKGNAYELKNMGFLVEDKKGNVRFMEELNTGNNDEEVEKPATKKPEVHAKNKLAAKKTPQPAPVEVADEQVKNKKEHTKNEKSTFLKRRFLLPSLAFVVVLIALVLWFVLKPESVEEIKQNHQDMVSEMANDKLNPDHEKQGRFARFFKKKNASSDEVHVVQEKIEPVSIAPVMAPLSRDTVRGILLLADKNISPKGQERYNVMVGSFKDIKNAEKLQDQLIEEGYGAQIFDRYNGWKAVALGGFPSLDIALRVSGENVKQYPDLWILVK